MSPLFSYAQFTSLGARIGRRIDHALFSLRNQALLRELSPHRTRLSLTRLAHLEEIAYRVISSKIEGDYIEFGTWKGGSLAFVASIWKKIAPERALYGLDSFEGLPTPHPFKDSKKLYQGMFGTKDNVGNRNSSGFEEVSSYFMQKNLNNVHLIKGWFQDTVPLLPENARFSFVHIDCDLYEGVSYALSYAFPRLSPGGVIILDDYGNRDCPGATIATEEFFAGKKEVIGKVLLGESCIIVKSTAEVIGNTATTQVAANV